MTQSDREAALASKAWPFEEAMKLIRRYGKAPPEKGYVLFSTGYGPSGLPHIGTFGEVARTSMVRHAFGLLSDLPTRLFAFSDDLDGLRKVPDNVPKQDMLREFLGHPLTEVPDPFGKFDSFGAHNNAMLRDFLDRFGFQYEFQSATACYRSGQFDATLLKVLAKFDEIQKIMLPTLGRERAASYSPFMPIDPQTRKVLLVPTVEFRADAGTIIYRSDDGRLVETPVTGGHCKLQWKVDWAMRWAALGVDYEMYGKDLIPSADLSARIVRHLGGAAPDGFSYELFLDEAGQKISKSKGNGLTIEEWLTYATPESLALYMYQKPKQAKRLHFDVIPRAVDDYLAFLAHFPDQPEKERFGNPVWHIHGGKPPAQQIPISFAMLLNLVGAANAKDKAVLWGFISRYVPGASAKTHPELDLLVEYAINYYRDFILPNKAYRSPSDAEKAALLQLKAALEAETKADADRLQTAIYETGKQSGYENLREWFGMLYQVLLGQEQGPRMGSFVALYGLAESIALIDQAITGKLTR